MDSVPSFLTTDAASASETVVHFNKSSASRPTTQWESTLL